MNTNQIRKAFFDFFKSKSHVIVNSAPMVLKDDPSLMFTNAGMNQFKDVFLGHDNPIQKRVANSQKCLRVSGKHNDLEEVGVDTYHHTMFEMLGNWSFGDYFKKEAINWAWDLFTNVYKIDSDRLYVTVFKGDSTDKTNFDQESYDIWKNLISEERILKFSKKDNFWEMGNTGPCGPSSEIHIDIRSDKDRKSVSGKELVNKDHPKVIELWNLVFIEYNRTSDGNLEVLKKKHVDTGMGLERLAMVLQSKNSNYDSDLFLPLITRLEKLSKLSYIPSTTKTEQSKINIAFRVVVDHIRAVAFSISDGQLPSNNGAGYVIRRILRRAVRYGYQFLKFDEPFLHLMVEPLAESFEGVFDEISKNKEFIKKIIFQEELLFFNTLSSGIKRLDEIVDFNIKEKKSQVDGKLVFELYDTYGFPLDLTKLIAEENKLSIDEKDFKKYLIEQKNRSKVDAKKDVGDWTTLIEDDIQEFVGYDHTSVKIKVAKYRTIKIKNKETFQLIFNLTPFFPEGGGQVGDKGFIINSNEKIIINDTKKENGIIVHDVDKLPKNIKTSFDAKVDEARRIKIMKNHSATHLLHFALRKVLGKHVEQKGSLINSSYLRFDFSHFSKLTNEEISSVESQVNQFIRAAHNLKENRNVPIEIAKQQGAMMLFGEKYGDSVRTIQFGESIELCGGLHVKSTSLIGNFKVVSESSISSGIRRIEAVTSQNADKFIDDKLKIINDISKILKHPNDIINAIEQLQKNNLDLQKKVEILNNDLIIGLKNEILSHIIEVNKIKFIYKNLNISSELMKKLAFDIKNNLERFVLIFTSVYDNRPLITLMISKDLVQENNWNAGKMIRELAKLIKGGGGGQPFFATAGGTDISGINQIELKARDLFFN